MKRLMAFLLLCILAGQATAAGLFARLPGPCLCHSLSSLYGEFAAVND